MIAATMRERYDANNDASKVTFWDMALATDIEQLERSIQMLQISVGNLHTEIGELKRQIAALQPSG
jgi:hypothetical protein